ncbi:hypothetical protein SH580_04720 [Coraliomargarita algicola]|uniref:Uncharacterized protein n=1 Tax=Coraliomargarita algicola TaxID=3092156 RepID=A0ABZ0RVL2_9BACT|nr:hypothetical protein [Coraliomargarita sp. J2-16]WPJ97009.1 hypothetical protein SH580_04720 [Coraliomargarita sp. J2-16]
MTPAAAKPEPSGNPQALDLSQLSPEQLAHYEAWQARSHKEQQVIMLSATVYEHAVTRLSWRFADGSEPSEYIAFTNADFNLLRGTHALSTDSHDFTFFMGIGDASSEDNPYSNKTVPDLSNFSNQRSEYLVIQGAPEHEAAFAGIEALLAHYDTNLAELKIKQQRREALTAAKQRYDAKHPQTEPEPFIMEFWVPEKSAKP